MKSVMLLLVGLALIVGPAEGTEGSDLRWKSRMRQLGQTLQALLPDILNYDLFFSGERDKEINRNFKRLAKLAHGLKPEKLSKDQDPTLRFIADFMKDDMAEIEDAIRSNNRSYLFYQGRKVIHYCVACHTRAKEAPRLGIDLESSRLKRLSPFFKGEFLTATRRFDQAIKYYEKHLADKKAKTLNPQLWRESAERALTIMVRVKNDVDGSISLVRRTLKQSDLPYYFMVDLGYWMKSLEQWKNEKPVKKGARNYLKKAQALIEEARRLPYFENESSKAVLYLRASSYLHRLLREYPRHALETDALLHLGICYENLDSIHIWSLHEVFYSACVYSKPKSKQAKHCYARLENDLLGNKPYRMGEVPKDLRKRLKRLKKVAF